MTNIQEMINKASLPSKISASAGTGKTYCLVEKVKLNLISQGINQSIYYALPLLVDSAQEFRNRNSKQ